MLIEIINKNAEEAMLLLVEEVNRKNTAMVGLYFRLSGTGAKPVEEDIISMFKSVLNDHQTTAYLFQDGDMMITWNGAQKALIEEVKKKLYERYKGEGLDYLYDFHAHGEELRLLAKKKIATLAPAPKPVEPTKPEPQKKPDAADRMIHFQAKLRERKGRMRTEILIVEDQAFSRRLLTGMLDKDYKTYEAESAEAAWEIYLERAPDIIFLDIELPGKSGHQLAEDINRIDPNAHIIMVTGNSYMEDVLKAKSNDVKAYVVKPYSKQKIFDSLKTFKR